MMMMICRRRRHAALADAAYAIFSLPAADY